jgi:hypothetical protein
MRARDVGVVDLFHDDAQLIGLGMRRQGRESIGEFYRGIIERAGPTPRLVGGLVDLFVVEEGRIRSLTYFIANE